nr:hypothetical protein [Actinomycetota bacterium]
GAAGLVVARDIGFAEPRGALMGWSGFELGLLTVNPLGAILTLVSGLAALTGAVARRWAAVVGAAGALALMSAQVIVQWGGSPNWLGSRGTNLSFWLAAAVALASLSWVVRVVEQLEPQRATPAVLRGRGRRGR